MKKVLKNTKLHFGTISVSLALLAAVASFIGFTKFWCIFSLFTEPGCETTGTEIFLVTTLPLVTSLLAVIFGILGIKNNTQKVASIVGIVIGVILVFLILGADIL